METFEDWLETVPALALRELAGGDYALRKLTVEQVRKHVRTDPDSRYEAELSYKIEREAREWMAEQDPRVIRDLKIRYGLVD